MHGPAWFTSIIQAASKGMMPDAFRADRRVSSPCNGSAIQGAYLWECAKASLSGIRGDSLVIFDWDDTLFPTTALASVEDFLLPLSLADLADWSVAVAHVLRVARTVSSCVIVTNSDHGWVQETVARWFPGLASEMVGIPIISARSIFEAQGIADAQQRKVLCFQRIVQCLCSGTTGTEGTQSLVSIGDSLDEHEACMQVSHHFPCYAKSLKLLQRPTMAQLVQQLDVVSAHLPKILAHKGDLVANLGHMVAVEGLLASETVEKFIRSQTEIARSEDKEPGQKKRRISPYHASCLGA